ncbi:MAG: hypothetical protein AAF570_03700 [Bacteroidota bacterium]
MPRHHYFTLLFLFVFPICSLFGQISQPYCAWEDPNSGYHIARVDPATGTVTSIAGVPGMTGIVAPNTSVFKPTTGEYLILGLFTQQIAWLRFNVTTGAILNTTPVNENWVGLQYHCQNDTIYGLRENNNAYELVWIDPVNAVAHNVANLPGVTAHVGSSFTLNSGADTYTFVGLMGASLEIIVLDLDNGAILSNMPFPYNVPGQYFDCMDGKIYGLVENQQTQTYFLSEVQPTVGAPIPTYPLSGVTPGFVAESATFNGSQRQFTYRGFDSLNNFAIIAVDGSNGNILANTPLSTPIAGLEDSTCCRQRQ